MGGSSHIAALSAFTVPSYLSAALGAGSGQVNSHWIDVIAQACQPQPNIILQLNLVPQNLSAALGAGSGQGITHWIDVIAQAYQPQPNIILQLNLVPQNLSAALGAD